LGYLAGKQSEAIKVEKTDALKPFRSREFDFRRAANEKLNKGKGVVQ
jgi:hypothetical protein